MGQNLLLIRITIKFCEIEWHCFQKKYLLRWQFIARWLPHMGWNITNIVVHLSMWLIWMRYLIRFYNQPADDYVAVSWLIIKRKGRFFCLGHWHENLDDTVDWGYFRFDWGNSPHSLSIFVYDEYKLGDFMQHPRLSILCKQAEIDHHNKICERDEIRWEKDF